MVTPDVLVDEQEYRDMDEGWGTARLCASDVHLDKCCRDGS